MEEKRVINKLTYQGRLVRDIDLKYTQSHVAQTEFTIAWSEKYNEIETKCFLRCKAWRKTAEFLEKYFRKGQEMIVEGKMVTEEWEKDGDKKSRTICIIDKVHFCGKKDGYDTETRPMANQNNFISVADGVDEELPFN